MLLIAAFPIFGLCVFLLFGRSNLTRSMKKRYELIDEELFPFLNGDDEVIKELQEKRFVDCKSVGLYLEIRALSGIS